MFLRVIIGTQKKPDP